MSDVEKVFKTVGDFTTGGFFSRKDAEKEQKKARRVQQRLQRARAARERRAQVREAIRAQAEVQQASVASNTSQTSSAVQGIGSIKSQLGSNLSFLSEQQRGAEQISIFSQRAANALSRAATFEAAKDLAKEGASLFGGDAGG